MAQPQLVFCVALFNYAPSSPNETPLTQAAMVSVSKKGAEGWWFGASQGQFAGLFPSTYVKEFSPVHLSTAHLLGDVGADGYFRAGDVVRVVHRYDNGFLILFSDLYRQCCVVPESSIRLQPHPMPTAPMTMKSIPPVPSHAASSSGVLPKPLPKAPTAPKKLPPAPAAARHVAPLPPAPTAKPLPASPATVAAKEARRKAKREKKLASQLHQVDERRKQREKEEAARWERIEAEKQTLLQEQKRKAEERAMQYKARSEEASKEKGAQERALKEEEERAKQLHLEAQEKAEEERRQRIKQVQKANEAQWKQESNQEEDADTLWEKEMMESDGSEDEAATKPEKRKASKKKKKKKRSKAPTDSDSDDDDDDECLIEFHGTSSTLTDNLESLSLLT